MLANYTDRTSLRNNIAFKLASLTDLEYTPRMFFCDVYSNGDYIGIYNLTEHLKVSAERINIGKNGYVIEVTPSDRIESDESFFSTQRLHFTFKDPDVEYETEQYNWIKQHINKIENILYSHEFASPHSGYSKYIDVESFADWYIVNELTKNPDARMFASCFMNIVRDEKLKMGPVWDFDIAFGNCNYSGCESYEGFWIKESPWFERLFKDTAFVNVVRSRFKKMKQNQKVISSYIRMQSIFINNARVADNKVWQYLGVPVWPNYVVFDSFEKEVQYLQDWLNQRFDWLEKALDNL